MESRLLAFLSDKEQKDKNDSNIAQLNKKRRKKTFPAVLTLMFSAATVN